MKNHGSMIEIMGWEISQLGITKICHSGTRNICLYTCICREGSEQGDEEKQRFQLDEIMVYVKALREVLLCMRN